MLLFNIINEELLFGALRFQHSSLHFFFFFVHNFTSFYIKFVNLALKSFPCWLVPSALFSLLSFPFFLVPATLGLSRPVPNPTPHPFQAICVRQCWMSWQFTPGAVGEITRDNLWLAGKTHLTSGLFRLLTLTHSSPSCSLAVPAHLDEVSSRLPRQVSLQYF